jgi:tetratricopeptide (TPR) repeat protein
MAITEGYMYIEKNNFTQAIDSFQRAFALEPSSQTAISGMFEAQQRIITNKVIELEKKANKFENQEQWQLALNTYNEILSMDDNIQVAKSGILKTNKIIFLESELDRLLSQPKRLESLDVASEARKIISGSEELKLGPRLKSKINSLISTLDQYSIKVKLKLVSNGKTTITIQRAGNIGKFKNKELQLSPGKYTFIGKRPGYKTVRKTIEIKSNSTLEIACFQKI